MAESPDSVAAQVAKPGAHESPEEPRDQDYKYIATKVAARVVPIHYTEDAYDGRGREDHEAMARLHVYRHVIDGYDSWPAIARHVKYTDGVADALGLGTPPSRETVRRSWHQQFQAVQDRLEGLARDLRDEIGWGQKGVLRAMGVDDDSQSYPEFTEDGIRDAAKDRAYKRIRPILTDIIDYERAENASVPADDLTEYAGWLARRRKAYPDSMDNYVTEEELDAKPFSPETFRRAVRNKEREKTKMFEGDVEWAPPRDWSVDLTDDPGGTHDWHSTAEEGIEQFVAELEEEGLLDEPVPVCIDGSIRNWHKHPDGADKKPTGVYQEAYFDTNYGWKDITATAIIDGRAVVLANVSMVPGDRQFQALKYLVDRSRELVDVEGFLGDAEFSSVKFVRYLKHVNEAFVFRKGHTPPVKEEFEDFSGKADWTDDFTMKTGVSKPGGIREVDTTLFAVEKRGQIGVKKGETRHEDHKQAGLEDFVDIDDASGQLTFADLASDEDDDVEYVAFITNMDIESTGIDPEEEPIGHDPDNTVWGLAEFYRRRWSIETTFRQVKHQFLPNTCSRDLSTRRFVWLMGLMLYNAWATLNLFIQKWVPQVLNEDGDPPVQGKLFLEEIANIDYG